MSEKEAEQLSLASDIVWLHYIEGLSQAEIAERRGLSRMKVHRLIQIAHDHRIVRISIDRVPDGCAKLETELVRRFGLTSCVVAPDGDEAPDMFAAMPTVANAAAGFLHAKLESTEPRVIGIGSGRTVAAAVAELAPLPRPRTSFVSMTGDFAVLNDANPFEVINALVTKTGGKGHALTAPLVVESPEDRELFLRQRGVLHAMRMIGEAEFFFTGVGHTGTHSFFDNYKLLTAEEQVVIRNNGAVADIAGNLLNAEGSFVETGLAQRMLAAPPALLRERPLIVAVGGIEKKAALRSALLSGCVNGLVTHAALARAVLSAR